MADKKATIKEFDVALRLTVGKLNAVDLEKMWRLFQALHKRGGDLTLQEICQIDVESEEMHRPKIEGIEVPSYELSKPE